MNILDTTGLEFYQLILLIITIVASIVVIRVTISFDINDYLKTKKASYISKLQNACPHVELKPNKQGKEARLLFISPPGTVQWQCQKCGAIRYLNNNEGEEMQKYYLDNVDEYNRKMKRFSKLLKKSGHI